MTNREILCEKLAEWQPAGDGRHSLTLKLPDNPWTVSLSADRVESIGCLTWELVLTRAEASEESLADAAARVAERAVGLLEPVVVHEIDGGRGEALVRSSVPDREGDSVAYHEICLRGNDRVTLRRYRASTQPGQRREQVAFKFFES